jgi:hypothetical protein
MSVMLKWATIGMSVFVYGVILMFGASLLQILPLIIPFFIAMTDGLVMFLRWTFKGTR